MNRLRWFWLLTILLLVACFVLLAITICRPRVIAEAVAPNGVRVCVVQTLGEPFNTATYVRQTDGQWRWFYLDHEDGPWLRGSIEIDAERRRLRVMQDGKPRAAYDWVTGIYYIGNDNGRDGSAMPNGWDLFKDMNPRRRTSARLEDEAGAR